MLAAFLPLLALASAPADVPAALESAVNAARRESGGAPLDRRAELDAVASRHARELAALAERGRFDERESVEDRLRAAGIRDFVRARPYHAWHRGVADDARAAVENWRAFESNWRDALDPRWGAAGFATARSGDGALVVVAVLVEPWPTLPDLDVLESRVLDAMNRERAARGLSRLEPDPALGTVARAHSRDMLDRDYFSHRSPEGIGAARRVTAAGIAYRLMAENITQSTGAADPVAEAVKQWMASPAHRENALRPEFTRTGVGVAVDAAERRLLFTQLFVRPLGLPEPE